mmetsp:Transcript_21916/g.60010  ORF Transcript_21916/g.60010 Transcript_21916/m.60010 type:complete len:191 (-) Transcript_21916:442-1014(-)
MCSLSANVLFLLKSQIDVALRYPALQIVDDSYRLNWELFNSPIPECEIVDSELLYVEAAVYLHRIALSSKTFLTSPEGEEQIKLRILSLTEEKCHCHSIEELFGEFWNASKQKRDYHWKMYFILLSSSAFIERILNDVFCAFSQSEKVAPPLLRDLLSTSTMDKALQPGVSSWLAMLFHPRCLNLRNLLW